MKATKHEIMRKVFLLLCSLYLASCACYYEDIRREGEEVLNPTSYVYDFPRPAVKRVLDSCFVLSRYEFPPDARERYRENLKSLVVVPKVGDTSSQFSNNQDTLYPVSFPQRSYVFKNRKGQFLWAYSQYILRVDSLGKDKTKIEIFLHDNDVTIGRKLGFNPVSNGLLVPRCIKSTSTTIEEYEILKYVGNKLGQKGMPPIHYPKAMTREEILDHFRQGNSLNFPFAEEDIYW